MTIMNDFAVAIKANDYVAMLKVVEDDYFDINWLTNGYDNPAHAIAIALADKNFISRETAYELVSLFLSMGVDPNRDLFRNEDSLLTYAIDKNDETLFNLALAQPGTKAVYKDYGGRFSPLDFSPLKTAIKKEREDFATALREKGHAPLDTNIHAEIISAPEFSLKKILIRKLQDVSFFEKAAKPGVTLNEELKEEIHNPGVFYMLPHEFEYVSKQYKYSGLMPYPFMKMAQTKDKHVQLNKMIKKHENDKLKLELLYGDSVFHDIGMAGALFANAVACNNIEAAKFLAENFPVCLTERINSIRKNVLDYAREQGLEEIVKLIKSKQKEQVDKFKAFVFKKDLLPACQAGDVKKVMRYLKETTIGINEVYFPDEELATPFMVAAASGQRKIMELLLKNGADTTVINKDGKTAEDIAREHGYEAMTDIIKENKQRRCCIS